MKPILYESTETDFNPNTRSYGLGVLSDSPRCNVVEELNDAFELEMDYPITGIHYEDIKLDRIILANSKPRQTNAQAFRIYEITKPINGIVEVRAKHISYDMTDFVVQPKFKNDITVDPATAENVVEAMSVIKNLSYPVDEEGQPTMLFNLTTNMEKEGEFTITQPASVRSFLGTDDGSLVDIYGGEWEFDNYHCSLLEQRGSDKGVKILYGVNMTDLEQEENIEEMYTAVYPYAVHENGSLTYIYRLNPDVPADKEIAPDAPLIRVEGTFERDKVLALDVSSNYAQFPSDHIDPTPDTTKEGTTSSGKPTNYQLYNAAVYYMNENNIGEPKVDLKVSFADLWNVVGEALFHEVDLGDTVHVHFEKLGVDATARCVKATFNVLLDRYESLELGEAQSDLAETVANQTFETRKVRKDLKAEIYEATEAITGQRGGYVVMHDSDDNGEPDEILIMDKPSIEEAGTVWRFNLSGWGVSEDGYDGPYGMAAYLTDVYEEGQLVHKKGFVADFITTGTLRSLIIQNGVKNQSTGKYPFEVDSNGNMVATSAKIAGWTIDDNSIYYGTKGTAGTGANDVTLMSSDTFIRTINGTTRQYLKFAIGGNFAVDRSGYLYAAQGNISGWTIDSNSIYYGTKSSGTSAGDITLMSSSTFTRKINGTSRGSLKFAIGGNFGVSSGGALYCSSGNISGWTIDSDSIYYGTKSSGTAASDITLMSSNVFTRTIGGTSRANLKFAIGGSFAVNNTGALYASSGVIAGWNFDSDSIYYGNKGSTGSGTNDVTLMSTSTFTRTIAGASRTNLKFAIGSKFGVSDTGVLYAGDGVFAGSLDGATGSFAGSLNAASGTFTGSLQAATGTFAGVLSAATGSFAGSLSAATGTFKGELSAATGTFAGSLSAATGSFKGTVDAEAIYARSVYQLYSASEGSHRDAIGHSNERGTNWGPNCVVLNPSYHFSKTGVNGILQTTDSIYDAWGKMVHSSDNNIQDLAYGYAEGEGWSKSYLHIGTGWSGTYGIDWWASDRKLKKNIEDSSADALDAIMQIQHRSFDWKASKGHTNIGYVAQELQEVIPEAVYPVGMGEDATLQISASSIIPYLSKAIQQLNERLTALEAR